MIPPHDTAAPVAVPAIVPPTAYRYMTITIDDAAVQGSVGYRFVALTEIEVYDTPISAGSAINSPNNRAQFASVTASPNHISYSDGSILNNLGTGNTYGNAADLPAVITLDFGASPVIPLSYAITNATDIGNAPAFPTAWTVRVGNDLGAMNAIDTRTAQTFTQAERKAFDL